MRPTTPIPPGEISPRVLPRAWMALGALLAIASLLLVTQFGSSDEQVATPVAGARLPGAAPWARRSQPHRSSAGRPAASSSGSGAAATPVGATATSSASGLAVRGGEWTTFAGGATRTTPFGAETVTVGSQKTEQFLTVRKRQGVRTWRWQLDAGTLEPKSSVGGRIDLLAGKTNSGLSIAPVAILDGRWPLGHPGRHALAPRADRPAAGRSPSTSTTAKLSLPYVIDPAANYPTPLRLRSTASTAIPTSWVLNGATGAANTLDVHTARAERSRLLPVQPRRREPDRRHAGATATGRGWVVDPLGGATGFPAGHVELHRRDRHHRHAHWSPARPVLAVGIWKGTFAGPAVRRDPGRDRRSSGPEPAHPADAEDDDGQLHPAEVLAGRRRDALRRALAPSDRRDQHGTATNRRLALQVNDASSLIAHPAADSTAPTPALVDHGGHRRLPDRDDAVLPRRRRGELRVRQHDDGRRLGRVPVDLSRNRTDRVDARLRERHHRPGLPVARPTAGRASPSNPSGTVDHERGQRARRRPRRASRSRTTRPCPQRPARSTATGLVGTGGLYSTSTNARADVHDRAPTPALRARRDRPPAPARGGDAARRRAGERHVRRLRRRSRRSPRIRSARTRTTPPAAS